MSERKSAKIKLKFKVRDNLDEFFVASTKDSDHKPGSSEDVHSDVDSEKEDGGKRSLKKENKRIKKKERR